MFVWPDVEHLVCGEDDCKSFPASDVMLIYLFFAFLCVCAFTSLIILACSPVNVEKRQGLKCCLGPI